MSEGTAQDHARQLAEWTRKALVAAGHTACDMLGAARYAPEDAVVICGCGIFADAPQKSGPPTPKGGSLDYVTRDPIQSTLALIDASEVYTPEQVEQHILDVLYRLETGALFERQAIRTAYAAEQDFDRAYYLAFHVSEQTSDSKRKAEAMVKTEAMAAAAAEAKMVKDAAKATMHNLRAILSGYQSTARSIASAYQGGGSPGRLAGDTTFPP